MMPHPLKPLGSTTTEKYVVEFWAEFTGPQNVVGGTIRLNERGTNSVGLQVFVRELRNAEKFLRLRKAVKLVQSELGSEGRQVMSSSGA